MKMTLLEKSPSRGEGIMELKILSSIERVKSKDSKDRLATLKKELLCLEKAYTDCLYEQPKKRLETQKIKTLKALANNSVYLNPKWVIDHQNFLLGAFVKSPLCTLRILTAATERELPGINTEHTIKGFVSSLVKSSGAALSGKETTLLENIIALPGYKYVMEQRSLSTESDYVNKTTIFCEKLVYENNKVILYAEQYRGYMQNLNRALEQNSQAFKSLGKDLETSLRDPEVMDDEEAMLCISKCLSLKYEEEDAEVKAILEKSENFSSEHTLSHQLMEYSPLEKEIPKEESKKSGTYSNRLLSSSRREGAFVELSTNGSSASYSSLSSTSS